MHTHFFAHSTPSRLFSCAQPCRANVSSWQETVVSTETVRTCSLDQSMKRRQRCLSNLFLLRRVPGERVGVAHNCVNAVILVLLMVI